MENNKPTLYQLVSFTKKYIKKDTPQLIWEKMDYLGYADNNKNIIALNPDMPVDKSGSGCSLGGGVYYQPSKLLKLASGEQYFLTLIHEIGHFKITFDNTKEIKEAEKIKKEAIQMVLEEEKLADRFNGMVKEKYIVDKKWLQRHANDILIEMDYLFSQSKKPNETKAEYEKRRNNFHVLLAGEGSADEHRAVEEWAINEFIKQRSYIKKILATP